MNDCSQGFPGCSGTLLEQMGQSIETEFGARVCLCSDCVMECYSTSMKAA